MRDRASQAAAHPARREERGREPARHEHLAAHPRSMLVPGDPEP